jgi:branched-chain amino acid transport system substrate-binding protein
MGAATGAAAQTAKAPVQQIKIGVLTDKNSVYADIVGEGSVLAAQMAVDDFLAAEKPGFGISVISADHTGKPDAASNIARQWFDEQGVDVIADIAGAGVTLAISKLGAQKNKLILATASAQNSLSGVDCQPTTLHWTYNTWAVSGTTARAVAKAGGDSWFFLTADYAGGRSMEEDAAVAVIASGGKVLGSVKQPLGTSDLSSALLRAQSSGANVIGLANAGGDTTTSIKQANEFGIPAKQKLAGMLVFITDVHALGLDLAQGLTVTSPFYWDLNQETRSWSRRFFKVRQKMPSMAQAGLYSAVLHYLRAVKVTNTSDTASVIAQMRATPVNDMFAKDGHLREDNLLIHDMFVFEVKKPSESKYPWDYYFLKETVKGEQAFQPLADSKCPLVKPK